MRYLLGVSALLLLAGVTSPPAFSLVVAEHWAADTNTGGTVSAEFTNAQAFEVTGAPVVSEIQLRMSRWSGTTGWVRVGLCPDVNGEPGIPTASVLVPVDQIPRTHFEWIPFQWSSSTLWTGTWWITAAVSGGSDGDITWMSSGGNTYGTGGDAKTSKDGGATWPIVQKSDRYFKVFGARTSVSTITTITPDPATVTSGGRTKLDIHVKESPGGAPVGGHGFVNLSATGGTLGAAQVELTNGTASTTWDAPVSTGGYTIYADYLGHVYGGSDYQTSSGNGAVSVIVEDRTTSTAQNLSTTTMDTRTSVTCSVTVKDNLDNPVPGGKVTFTCTCSDGSFSTNPANVNGSGQASTTWTAGNTTGDFTITAGFSGHSTGGINYGASSDADTVTVDYTDVPTTTTVAVSPDYPYVGGKAWVKATVKDGSGGMIPSGTVQLAPPSSGYFDSTTVNIAGGTGSTIYHPAAAITGDVLISGTFQQKTGSGNRYLPSTGNATAHVIKDPDSGGGDMTYMLEWITNYKWWQLAYSDLDNTDDDARGFGHKLRDDFGWTGHDYGNDSAQQDDFKLHALGGKNNDYLDAHDFTYYSGHGSADNISFNNLNDAVRLWSFQALDAWGDGDCEWVLFSACNVMQDDEDWADCFNGAHLQCGYTTTMDDDADFGGVFANLLTKENLNDEPHRIAQAFFLAGDLCLDDSHKQRVIGESDAMFDDFIWGQGYVNPDPADNSSYSSISNHVDVNNAPQADADGPYNGIAGVELQLDATNTWDPDSGDTLTYVWDMDTSVSTDNGDYDGDGNGAEPDDDGDCFGRRATYTYTTSGLYNIKLNVHDAAWSVDSDTTTADIADSEPGRLSHPPVVSEEDEEIEIVDNFGSLPPETQLPQFDLVSTIQGYNEMMNISNYYGMSGSAEIDSVGNWSFVQGSDEVIVNQYSGAVAHFNRAQTYTFTHPPGPLPDQGTCIAIAEAFMNTNGIQRDGAALSGFTDVSIETKDKGTHGHASRLPFQRCVDYRRQFTVGMNTYPAVGPGGKLRVVVDDYGDARGFVKVWRDVVQGDMLDLVPAAQAIQKFHDLVGDAVYAASIVPECNRIEIDNVYIGYYEESFVTFQQTIYPVYVLDLTCEDDTSTYYARVCLPAAWDPLDASIDYPSDESDFDYGEEITFGASASGGTPPYSYAWYSDVDGYLGSGASLACSDLSVNQRSAEPTMHAIEVRVTDDNGQTASEFISILINPGTIADAKESADGSRVALLGPVVTGSFSSSFYVEQPDRIQGIAVVSGALPPVDSVVLVEGVMDTQYDERCIVPTSIQILGQTDPIDPLFINLRGLGGGDFGTPPLGQKGVDGGFGFNNIGLLVRVAGEVDWVASSGAPRFTITDGVHRSYCYPMTTVQIPQVGDFCEITGISCIGYLPGGQLWRMVLIRDQSDILVVQ